jgi:hypothetical protein
LILGTHIQEWKQKVPAGQLKLSQIMSMYYSEDGVFTPQYRACQRRDLYSEVAPITVMEDEVRKRFGFLRGRTHIEDFSEKKFLRRRFGLKKEEMEKIT